MIRSERKRQGGFTLLEMLIAMAVFAVMSMVAYQGLRAVLDADHITREQAQRLADLQVTLSVLERDLAQVVDVRVRDEFGDPLPPLRLRAGGEHQLLELVRAGAGGDQRLRRTAWQITERGLERRLWPGVDIVDPESMRVRPFADLVAEDQRLGMDSAFHFIVRTQAGLDRVDAWPPAVPIRGGRLADGSRTGAGQPRSGGNPAADGGRFMRRCGPQRQRGVALITALLVMALAVVAAVAMAVRGQADIRRTSAVFERDFSRQVARGAENMVLQMLERADGPEDLVWDTCRSPVLPFEVDGVRLEAFLDDMRCRYNLNALGGGQEAELADFARLVDRVSQESGVRMPPGAQLALAVADWMDAESDDPVYRLENPARVSGNRPMVTASEINSVAGMTAEAWQALAPYVTAYPGSASPIDLERSPADTGSILRPPAGW